MTNKVKTKTLAVQLGVSPATINRLSKADSKFPGATKIGKENYFNADSIHEWLQSRATNSQAVMCDDEIISGARLLELTNRSKGWLWQNVIKPKTLTRINLSPDPKSNKLINNFIGREVYEAFGDLIDIAKGEG